MRLALLGRLGARRKSGACAIQEVALRRMKARLWTVITTLELPESRSHPSAARGPVAVSGNAGPEHQGRFRERMKFSCLIEEFRRSVHPEGRLSTGRSEESSGSAFRHRCPPNVVHSEEPDPAPAGVQAEEVAPTRDAVGQRNEEIYREKTVGGTRGKSPDNAAAALGYARPRSLGDSGGCPRSMSWRDHRVRP